MTMSDFVDLKGVVTTQAKYAGNDWDVDNWDGLQSFYVEDDSVTEIFLRIYDYITATIVLNGPVPRIPLL